MIDAFLREIVTELYAPSAHFLNGYLLTLRCVLYSERKQVQQTLGNCMRRQCLLFLIRLSRKRLNKVSCGV
jgi:hypothetical protein